MEIKFKKLIPEAKTPFKAIDIDAGFDLYATAIKKTDKYIQYSTGIAVEIPEGYVGLVFPRSSVTKYDLILKNSVGIIDASYRGEIMCRFFKTNNKPNHTDVKYGGFTEKIYNPSHEENTYEVGERVAQIVFMELPKITLVEALELSDTERGSGGFGSTGK